MYPTHSLTTSNDHGMTVSTLRRFRRAALRRLAITNAKDTEAAELRCLGVGAEITDVEHRCLPAPETPRVGDLEQGGVAKGRQPSFVALGAGRRDAPIGEVEELLQFGLGEGALGGSPS